MLASFWIILTGGGKIDRTCGTAGTPKIGCKDAARD